MECPSMKVFLELKKIVMEKADWIEMNDLSQN